MSDPLSKEPRKTIFRFLSKNPDAGPHEVIAHLMDEGYRRGVPTPCEAAYCIRMFRVSVQLPADGQDDQEDRGE